jgi:hypothetical protein
MSEIILHNCPFCSSEARLGRNDMATFVICSSCAAKGPGVEGHGFEEQLRAAENWNRRGGFGNTRVTIANDKIPVDTYKLAERIRETAEGIDRGQLGSPDKCVMLLYNSAGKSLHVRAIRINQAEAQQVLISAVKASQAQAQIKDTQQ